MKIRKTLLLFFVVIHLFIIFFQGLWGDIDGFYSYHYDETLDIPILSSFKQNKNTAPYYILTGTDTGYGFYGIHTATNKFIRITYLDSLGKPIEFDRFLKLSTLNGIMRLEGYASYLANYMAETENLIKTDNIVEEEKLKLISFREDYIGKIFKWLGKKNAESIKGCSAYKVELLTILPQEINSGLETIKPKLYVVEQSLYPVSQD